MNKHRGISARRGNVRRWAQGPGAAFAPWALAAFYVAFLAATARLVWLATSQMDAVALALGAVALVTAVWLGGHSIRSQRQLKRLQRRLTGASTRDPLTGLANRRHLLDIVEREWALAHRYHTPCALALIDVDGFKRVNERLGSRCGDAVLANIAETIKQSLRQPDVVGRFGGEEFVLFLPHTEALGALDLADRIRARVEAMEFTWRGKAVPVTVSIGIVALHAGHTSLDQLIVDADVALRYAKKAGANRVRADAGLLNGHRSLLKH